MKQVSTLELQIAERARKFRVEPLTNLSQFITPEILQKEFWKLNKNSKHETDGQD